MQNLTLIGTVTLIHLLAVMSPGPDFIMAVKNSLTYSRRTGIWTAVGFGLGISVHIFYCIAGLALIISKSILLFSVIKYFGAAYLIYVGVKCLLSKSGQIDVGENQKKSDIFPVAAVRMGFLTNVWNPKVTLLFLSLFTLVITPGTPASVLGIVSVIMIANTTLWFSLVATFLTHKKIRGVFERFQSKFNKFFGVLLVAIGLKVAVAAWAWTNWNRTCI